MKKTGYNAYIRSANIQGIKATMEMIRAKSPAQRQADSDELFVNNLIALASVELALVKAGKAERVDRHALARWAFNYAQGVK